MYQEINPAIRSVIRPILGDHPYMDKVFRYSQETEADFSELLAEFDAAITAFNAYGVEKLPESWINSRRLKERLGSTALKTISSCAESADLRSLLQVKTASRKMAQMMVSGETNKVNPYLQYHISTNHIREECLGQALTGASIFHFTELFMLQDPDMPREIQLGDVEGALIEILSHNNKGRLWHVIADRDQLNWVDGWSGFSEDFRRELGFE